VDELKADIPRFVANVLNEISVLDSGTSSLPSPGTQLTQEDISKASAFPSLSLPPGPADVPAYHDFYDLHIAFKPVWSEALDNSLIGSVGAYYEHYVGNGGDPDAFSNAVVDKTCGLHGLTYFHAYLSVPEKDVQKHIDITNEEWTALTGEQRTGVEDIAEKIQQYFDILDSRFGEGGDASFLTKDNSEDIQTYNRTRQFVTDQIGDLQTQGERFVRIARAELERQASNKSIVPSNHTLNPIRFS
jgi:hypothetical protein